MSDGRAGTPARVAGPAYVVFAGKMSQSNKSPPRSSLTPARGDMITVLLHASIDPATY